MSRKFKVSAAALLVFTGLVGQAVAGESDSVEIRISGEAKPVCALPQAQGAGANASFSNNVMTIQKLIDDTNATVQPSSLDLTFQGVMCNYGATISIASANGGLASDETVSDLTGGAFLKLIPYRVQGSWGGIQLNELNTANVTAGGSVTTPAGGANYGDLTLKIFTEKGAIPVIQGEFTDILVLKVGAIL
jgi:hypothetical protein